MAPSASGAAEQRTSRFALRNLFSRQKYMPRVLKGAEDQTPTPEGSSSAPDHQQFRAGPEYAPAVSESEEQKLPTGALQARAVATTEPSSRRRPNARDGARLLFSRKQADALRDTRVEVRKTAQKIRRTDFSPSIKTQSSGLSLGKMIKRPGISADTKRLLKVVVEDLQEFKREQEQKRMRAEEKQEEIAVVEEAMEVVDTKVVRKGSTVRHVKVMRPAVRLAEGVTLDPNARPAISITSGGLRAGLLSSSSVADGQAAVTGPSSTTPMVSASIMNRGHGFKRRRLPHQSGVQAAKPPEKKCDSFAGSSNRIRLDFT
ncbi:hypothetical protein PMIN06_010971 [Paraphaeosphaeria minitans]|uniref:Uncharacterized protein n=1 Tax=Paraphaeosphaeria minitans TaxID=565426 RepID=A0A9P6GNM3_9PLEO|nr:hypothetical protein PMIN01_01656 [Paraphaeosphaeria minitans]